MTVPLFGASPHDDTQCVVSFAEVEVREKPPDGTTKSDAYALYDRL